MIRKNLQDSAQTGLDELHKLRVPLAACHKLVGRYNKLSNVFEHKTQYLLIHAPYTRIVILWHISNMSPLIL